MTFSQSTQRFLVAVVACCIVMGPVTNASAWGPRARQMVAVGALQFIRQKAPQAFTGGDANYEADLLRGAADGVLALGGTFPLNSDTQCMDAVQSQIQILREAWRNGAGSHFAYRMGGLSALTSEIIMPFGVAYTEEDRELKQKIDEYVDSRVDDFSFSLHHPNYQYILSSRLYLEASRTFHDSDAFMIKDDFKRGVGPKGLLKEAAPKYFGRAVHATVDVWYTVLRPEGETSDVRSSREQMALYYMEEVKYLLAVKGNMLNVDRSYDLFQSYNPGIPMANITLGDAFYKFGTEAGRDRAVKEWEKAYDIPGETRKAASMRLSSHYLEKGEALFMNASTPTATETDLPDALQAFNDALRYDRSSEVAASRIQETTAAIDKRREDYELQERFIANALTVMQAAERAAKINHDFAGAITSYNQASMLISQVTDDFKDLGQKARDTASEINKNIKTVISDVFASANDSIEKGDAALAANNVDEAVRFYSAVETIIDAVPSEEGSLNATKKQDMITTAQNRIDEAELQRRRLEQQQNAAPPPAAGIRGK